MPLTVRQPAAEINTPNTVNLDQNKNVSIKTIWRNFAESGICGRWHTNWNCKCRLVFFRYWLISTENWLHVKRSIQGERTVSLSIRLRAEWHYRQNTAWTNISPKITGIMFNRMKGETETLVGSFYVSADLWHSRWYGGVNGESQEVGRKKERDYRGRKLDHRTDRMKVTERKTWRKWGGEAKVICGNSVVQQKERGGG